MTEKIRIYLKEDIEINLGCHLLLNSMIYACNVNISSKPFQKRKRTNKCTDMTGNIYVSSMSNCLCFDIISKHQITIIDRKKFEVESDTLFHI